MSREISKRFAAIGDDISPPKAKPVPVSAPPKTKAPPRPQITSSATSIEQAQSELAFAMERGDPKMVAAIRRRIDELCREEMAQSGLREASFDWQERARWIRERVVDEFGSGITSGVIDGIVQAQIGYEEASMFVDYKKAAEWAARLAYIRDQARKQSSIVVTQEYDYINDQLLIHTKYPDGKQSINKIPRQNLQDDRYWDGKKYQYLDLNIFRIPPGGGITISQQQQLCIKCGQPSFYPDGKTYHLCSASIPSTGYFR